MSEDQKQKKHRKREARYFSWKGQKDYRGRKTDQKMKPFVTLAQFWKYSDENHVLCARDIASLLAEFEIDSERRSIYSDIKEINRYMLALEGTNRIWEADDLQSIFLNKDIYKVSYTIKDKYDFDSFAGSKRSPAVIFINDEFGYEFQKQGMLNTYWWTCSGEFTMYL